MGIEERIKRIESIIKHIQDDYKIVVELIPLPVFIVFRKTIIYVNRAALDLIEQIEDENLIRQKICTMPAGQKGYLHFKAFDQRFYNLSSQDIQFGGRNCIMVTAEDVSEEHQYINWMKPYVIKEFSNDQKQIMELSAKGLSIIEISRCLNKTTDDIYPQRSKIRKKFNLEDISFLYKLFRGEDEP